MKLTDIIRKTKIAVADRWSLVQYVYSTGALASAFIDGYEEATDNHKLVVAGVCALTGALFSKWNFMSYERVKQVCDKKIKEEKDVSSGLEGAIKYFHGDHISWPRKKYSLRLMKYYAEECGMSADYQSAMKKITKREP